MQRQINHLRICSIDHQRHFYLFDYQFQEQLNVFALIAVRILHTDIDHLRTALNLRPGNFRSFLVFAFHDQTFELP
ncbi:hypothetical protein D3C74_390720 [compost metagenome]